tara:strand:- start:450 stop:692 length:243 start_codon:yes stop_codon:yes gene_type:complete
VAQGVLFGGTPFPILSSVPKDTMALIDLPTEDFRDTVKAYFTDEQWDAIDRAMADFQDYGDEEAEMSIEIQSKIASLYEN